MNLLKISVTQTWLCATGVIVATAYCICTNCPDTSAERINVEKIAKCVSANGTIDGYKSKSRHSSASKTSFHSPVIKKTTMAKVVSVKKPTYEPTYVPNPLYPVFTNEWNALTQEYVDFVKDGAMVLTNGFVLTMKDGKPYLQFPEEYAKICIGGLAIGEELKRAKGKVLRKRNHVSWWGKLDEIAIRMCRRLAEPEFYCTDVTYTVLPSTRQIDAIRMHGNLIVGDKLTSNKMVDEITDWMKQEYGAVDLGATVPADMLALKKFRVGSGMNVDVRVTWKGQCSDTGCDADIDIAFTTSELVEENRYQRQKLGEATDAARVSTLNATGVNYFTVRPTVHVRPTVNGKAVKYTIVY